MDIVVDTRTGKRGTYEDWVAAFQERWADARNNLDRFMDILSPHVRLASPGFKTTIGRADGYEAFRRTFEAMPDIRGHVTRWAAAGDVLFVEMTFTATVGGRTVSWDDVDRFVFRDGVAVERVAYFDPTKVRLAYLGSLRGLLQFVRLRRATRRRGAASSAGQTATAP